MNVSNRMFASAVLLIPGLPVGVSAWGGEPLTHTFKYMGADRAYSIFLQKDFNAAETYWTLVVVHGGGGRGATNSKAIAMRQVVDELDLPAFLIAPDFNVKDKKLSQFPVPGKGAFLKAVLGEVRGKRKLHPKILLTDYSMGGQFTHPFASGNPNLVHACEPLVAGT